MEREDIARLFAGETIFLAGKSEQIVSGKKEAAIIDSGKDNPGLAIVLSDPAKITSEQRELLHNILKAINRDPSEVPLITPSRFDELSSGKYLCFGDA